jgi:formamidopyrimidine-DNA glycosylase
MPELPEVEVLVCHLKPLLRGRVIRAVEVRRAKSLRPTREIAFTRALIGSRFLGLERRGKYLVFTLRPRPPGEPFRLLGHLGMTGRMYGLTTPCPLPRHTVVALDLGAFRFVFEDTRYFGRLTLSLSALKALGPEPLGSRWTVPVFARALQRSRQPIKIKLLDQGVLAGVGNIYACEALHRARLAPTLPSRCLSRAQVTRLRSAIRWVLRTAIDRGSTVPLDWAGAGRGGWFYYGLAPGAPDVRGERLHVYDREGEPCRRCGTRIRRITQAARSTYYCPRCQASVPPARLVRRP